MPDNNTRYHPEFVERRHSPRTPPQAPINTDEEKKGVLVPSRFEARALPRFQQHLAWQERMAAVFDSRLPEDASPETGFDAQHAVWNLGGMLIVQQALPAFSYERSADRVRLSPLDHWQITVLRVGRTWNESGGHVAQNEPGMMEIRSLGQPFRGRQLATESISLIAPIDLFAEHGGLPAASSNVVLGGHRARLLIDHLSSVEANLEYLTRDDLTVVKDRLRELIFNAVIPSINRNADDEQKFQIGLITKARRFISNSIDSPDLTIESICKELGISRTRLYEIFETSGGVASYIRRRRLITAHAMLADPSDSRKVAEVGLAMNFDSPANFSRAFTQQFGYSPSHIYNQSARHNLNYVSPPDGKSITFESMLRTLGLF